MEFKLHAPFQATGDQPEAIEALARGVELGLDEQVLLGVTGSGKTFTMASVIEKVQRPTLVLAHNKTLAAQLCAEFKEFFPENAVEYFVSYYDYYQPEAYIPHTDTYIAKDASTLISLMFPLMRRIRASSGAHETILSDTEQAGAYFLDLFFGEREEKLYEACLDAKGRLLACHLVAEGDTESVQLNMRKIVENALKCGASSVLLSHNHPSGVALPSPADNATTLSVFDALRTVGVELADHIIVADDDFVSLRHNGLLPERKGNGYGI